MKTLYESGENYLEAIMMIKNQKGVVLSVDIAHHMGFSKASVSRAVKILVAEGYINVGAGGAIEFTQKGKETATEIYERHRIITRYLIEVLKVDVSVAEQDACRIEHVISKEAFEAIKNAVLKT